MKSILVVLTSLLAVNVSSQHDFSDDIRNMYEALSDSTKLKDFFMPDALVYHIDPDTNYSFTVNEFLGVCPKFESGLFSEEIVKIETNVTARGLYYADVYFKFYLNGEFHHCGIDHHCWIEDGYQLKIDKIYSYQIECEDEKPTLTTNPNVNPVEFLDDLMDKWHRDVAEFDFDAYFGFMDESFIFLGTDPSERWTKAEFSEFSKPYFDKGSTWDFTPLWRNWYFSDDGNTAWFEEQLDTWMEECRGSGVLKKVDGQWKITHYNLTVLIENEKIKKFIKLRKK